jgi:aldose 1-epimerase
MKATSRILSLAAAMVGASLLGAGLWPASASVALAESASVTEAPFGTMPDGTAVALYTLTNANGMRVTITNYGGTVTSITVPDRNGSRRDVVLGYADLAGYVKDAGGTYFGALIGRYGNRIAAGHFTLDGKTYTLPINNPPNTLHGGTRGFNKVVWAAHPVHHGGTVGLDLEYVSADGDQGFPGTLTTDVLYTLRNDNALQIDYRATTDSDTVVNLTNHCYFNLNGAASGTILDHELTIHADAITPVDANLIPTGALEPVAGTPFDFRTAHRVGERIGADDAEIQFGKGYDHNFVLGKHSDHTVVAEVYSPASGIDLKVTTTQPGVQFYTGNFLDGTTIGKGGVAYVQRSGLCLETQHYPDSPNHPDFPTTELKPGQTYREQTVYQFSTK